MPACSAPSLVIWKGSSPVLTEIPQRSLAHFYLFSDEIATSKLLPVELMVFLESEEDRGCFQHLHLPRSARRSLEPNIQLKALLALD